MASETSHAASCRERAARNLRRSFKAAQSSFAASIQGLTGQAERTAYASLLIRRLMFLYFLQKNGFLDGDTGYLAHRLQLVHQCQGPDNFYHSFLLPFFQAIFYGQGGPANGSPTCCAHRAPAPDGPPASGIQIPDEAFSALFTFFDAYTWRLDECARTDEQALDPSILAAIFEQHTHQRQMGAYYTKEDVTAYIAGNTIIPYLFAAAAECCPAAFAPGSAIWRLLQVDPERYIPAATSQSEYLPAETGREYTMRRARYRQLRALLAAGAMDSIQALITHNLAIEQLARDALISCTDLELLLVFYTSMERMSILDPTCGPGAFLLGALKLLVPLYAACLERMQALCGDDPALALHVSGQSAAAACRAILERSEQYASRERYILHTIIVNNLYGVDVMPEAVEVCRQRLLLALLARGEHIDASGTLPALDNNIRAGNALAASTWHAEFPAIMARGGFDVIIGNPPYIEYSKVRQQYSRGVYETGNCGNLYAAVVERSLALCRSRGSSIGLIVPLSLCGSERFARLRRTILAQTAVRWLANFEIFPGRLFDGAFQRLSILIALRSSAQCGSTYVTRIQRWYAAERPHLLDLISYTEVQRNIKAGVFPKLASPLQETILHKVAERAAGASIATMLASARTPHFVYYQEATNYWMKAICHVPFYKKNGVVMEPPHGRFLFFNDERSARTIMAIMNSSLFYLWFATYADGFHLSHALVKAFPVSGDLYHLRDLPLLSLRLEQDIQRHARRSTRNTRPNAQTTATHLIELDEYRPGLSRPIIDEIDGALARCYGFTNDELDFIMNFDIKYRLGQEDSRETLTLPDSSTERTAMSRC